MYEQGIQKYEKTFTKPDYYPESNLTLSTIKLFMKVILNTLIKILNNFHKYIFKIISSLFKSKYVTRNPLIIYL